MAVPLLATKLHVPPQHGELVPRPQLSARLSAGLPGKLTLVSAPAGFGKTTVVASWVRSLPHPVAWVSLDPSDDDPVAFWAYLVRGMQTALPDGDGGLIMEVDPTRLPPSASFLAQIINVLDRWDGSLVLVLDDYHAISDPHIHQDLAYLIDHQPSSLHIVIITRADPPLPISRLRGRGFLSEFRASDLRFTSTEAAAFLNGRMGLSLLPEEIRVLEKRTEGWAIGLQLAALSMQSRQDKSQFIAQFSGGHHFVLEYLVDEVFSRLPADRRGFMLRTAVLEQFCVALCDWVTGEENSAAQIDFLQQQNLFLVPLDDEYRWFRYHHLFRDLLQNHLEQQYTQEEIRGFLVRASQWYQQNGELEEAVRYALLARDFDSAVSLIEQVSDRVIARGQVKTLMQWIAALPEEVIRRRPRLLMQQGWVTFLAGQTLQASTLLQEARDALRLLPAGSEQDLLHGRLAAMLATLTALTRDLPSAMEQARTALVLLPEREPIFLARARRALGVCHTALGELDEALANLEQAETLALAGENQFLASEALSQMATVRKHQGKLSLAWAAYQKILDLYPHPESTPPACLSYIGLAGIALERNDLTQAEAFLARGLELGLRGSIGYPLQSAYLIGGWLRYARGDVQGALESVREAASLSRQGRGSLESLLDLAWSHARLCLQLGDVEKARAWANGAMLPPGWSFDQLPPLFAEKHRSLLAQVSLHSREFESALDICARSLSGAEAGGRLARVIEFLLVQSLALWHFGQAKPALESFAKCLSLAEPEGYTRIFIEAGEGIFDLLQAAQKKGICARYAAGLLSAFGAPPVAAANAGKTPPGAGLIEPLTEREMEVLRWMCAGRSNRQIAETLIVSVNTVKKFTSNIYGKLGVSNRAQAVLRALELGLIE